MKTNNTINLISKSIFAIVLLSQLAACNFLVAEAGLGGGTSGQRNADIVEIANSAIAADEVENVAEKANNAVASIILNWTAPSAREDQSSISMAEIAGFRVYYGTKPGEYTQYVDVNDAYVDEIELSGINLEAGTYYIVMTTIDTDGLESAFSENITIEV